ncbi:ADP-forming succinate--CoA ligase subunit beta [Nitratireductor sp. GCM10026969]|uniref:ADP-forming succinate--CoA ligase subunit beta n=1 Tax=Nitratireductor sp. GCM10026969 TaxID=3252645 RepID=UPI00360D70B6
MRLHEFQSKALLAGYGITVPEGHVALTAQDARRAADEIGGGPFAVKAQIQAGGRGRANAVRLVATAAEAAQAAEDLLGQRVTTEQTGPAGYAVRRVLVETALRPLRSLYLSLFIDARAAQITLLAGADGGVEIEDKVREGSARLERLSLAASSSLQDEVAELGGKLGLEQRQLSSFVALVEQLRKAFTELDAVLIELNPLAITEVDAFVALDAKMTVDDNALFRHPELAALRDDHESDEIELVAQNRQLNFVRMDGDIGLVANGAGLGLATLDMVRAANGRPANFMDIRTTATSLDVAHGFALLLDNPAVRAILVNVHGGGMQPCDTIADGLGVAMRRTGRSCPTVVRLAGNNAEYARFRFANFGCDVIDCPDMWSAVTRAVAIAEERGGRS